MGGRLRSLGVSLRSFGAIDGTMYLTTRIAERATRGAIRIRRYYLVAQPVTGVAVLPPHRGRSIEVQEATPASVDDLPVDRPRAVLAARFAQGARCLVARTQGRFLGFIWFVVGPYVEDEVRCVFEPRPAAASAWDFDVFVAPAARFSLTLPRLWDEANKQLAGAGVRWSMSRISAFNMDSLTAHRRLGAVVVGSATFFCAWGMQLMISTVRPYLHLSVDGRARPTIGVVPPA